MDSIATNDSVHTYVCIWRQRSKKNVNADVNCEKSFKQLDSRFVNISFDMSPKNMPEKVAMNIWELWRELYVNNYRAIAYPTQPTLRK